MYSNCVKYLWFNGLFKVVGALCSRSLANIKMW